MTATPYPTLFSPLRLGPKVARNRTWMSAHATLLVKDNVFTDEHVAYYAERAKHGVAVITMEAMAVHETSLPYRGKALSFDPRMVPQYRKIADAVHEHGALLLAQPWHRGRETNSVASGHPVWAPSAVPCAVYREMPHVMTVQDIDAIREGYRLSARHARDGGLDGVEVHSMSHGYLLNQFLSPATNHRDDAFGGSLENRLRLVMEIIQATREEVGADMIVGVRINSDDGHEGGLRPDDWAEIAARMTASGLIDYVSCSHGTYLNRMLIYPTSPESHGFQMAATRKVKQAVDKPVVGVGRIVTPAEAEKHLSNGDCDFVAMARALIADPEWVAKAQRGEAEDIRPCVGANWCMSSIFAQAPIACIHNPAAGQERELGAGTLKRADRAKKVAVVGGGPGGMRAALTARQRGHDVTLFERGQELGGQVRLWSRAPSRTELAGVADWLERQVVKAGVQIRLQTIATEESLLADGYDSIVVATGSKGLRHGWTPLRPEKWNGAPVPGTDQPHVVSYMEALRDRIAPGQRALIYDGLGGRQAVVTAEYLASQGAQVEFVTWLGQPAPDLAASRDWGKTYGMLKRMGMRFATDLELVAIEGPVVRLRDVYTKEEVVRDGIDTVVLALGAEAQDSLFHALAPRRAAGLDLRLIGDALAPRRADSAIREGEAAGRAI
ncbi:FAD-dependent oxidoreductase [Roseomonas stagni]|uniref:FAD-dependent oxidoreductase n=1 Tax=Falsiroseomonas algicola TaxID=2716930 RepID=A0A6M1LLN6_9PROT|nr:FAD-dependent oxidoreductase [Falsiroseomonas algicola]NGM20929.1 FAD-dependent oxidoreductase [Falsiroseomonas algicola]